MEKKEEKILFFIYFSYSIYYYHYFLVPSIPPNDMPHDCFFAKKRGKWIRGRLARGQKEMGKRLEAC